MGSGRASALRQSLPLLAAAAITSGLLFNGFNSAIGKAVSCLVACLLAIILLVDRRPSPGFWLRLLPALGTLGLAVLWLVGVAAFSKTVAGGVPVPFAADLVMSDTLGVVAGVAALVSGCLMGRDPKQAGQCRLLIVLFATVTFLIGLALRDFGTGGGLDYWSVVRQGRFAGTIGNINVTAAVAGGVVLLALGMAIDRATPRTRSGRSKRDHDLGLALALVLLFASVLALATVVLTAARFPTVALVLIALGSGAAATLPGHPRLRGQGRVLLAAAFLSSCLMIANADLLMERFGRLGSESAVRTMMWRHYFEIWLGSPVYGYGPGAFSEINTYRLDTPELARALWSVNSPHNIVLQLLLKGGLPYALLIAAAAWLIARPILRHLASRAATFEDRGVCAMILLLLACSLVDITLDVPAAIQVMAFLAGTIWVGSVPSAELAFPQNTAPGGDKRSIRV